MAAQKFGSILSDLAGLAKQFLRVKEDESGFEFATPATLPTYTITNDSTDREIDANASTVDEVADVLCTLIKDLETIYDGGPNKFQWSSSEQEWPFEKDTSGNTLYCKRISLGALPNNGTKQVAHNITGLAAAKIFKTFSHATCTSASGDSTMQIQLPYAGGGSPNDVSIQIRANGNVFLQTAVDYSLFNAFIDIIYSK